MSAVSEFLQKHEEILAELADTYDDGTYAIYGSEQDMSLGSFPCIGLFVGTPIISRDAISYVPVEYTFILTCADLYDQDKVGDQIAKQYSMYDLMEDVISKMGFRAITNAEPMISIASGEGSFITGWTILIKYNA